MSDAPVWLGACATSLSLGVLAWQFQRDVSQRRQVNRLAQAVLISAWYAGGTDDAYRDRVALLNSSNELVYNVVVTMVMVQGGGARKGEERPSDSLDFRRVLSALPPGRWSVDIEGGWAGMSRHPGIEVAFTDRAGKHWIRRSWGELEQIEKEPRTHYGMPLPVTISTPQPETN